jgi:hypothetical protein
MLTCEEACKIGQKACIDAIGYEFAVQNKSRCVFAYSELPGMIHCYVGVSDKSIPETKNIILDSTSKWTRSAECNVMLEDGQIKDLRIHGECDCCNASSQD